MPENAGLPGVSLFATAGELSLFAARAAREALLPPLEFRETMRQV
jgi:hypothetical protein